MTVVFGVSHPLWLYHVPMMPETHQKKTKQQHPQHPNLPSCDSEISFYCMHPLFSPQLRQVNPVMDPSFSWIGLRFALIELILVSWFWLCSYLNLFSFYLSLLLNLGCSELSLFELISPYLSLFGLIWAYLVSLLGFFWPPMNPSFELGPSWPFGHRHWAL